MNYESHNEESSQPPLLDRLSSIFSTIDLSKYTDAEFHRPPSLPATTPPSSLPPHPPPSHPTDSAVPSSPPPPTSPPPAQPPTAHWWPVLPCLEPQNGHVITRCSTLFLAGGFRLLSQGLVSQHMVEMCGPAESMRVVLSVSEESGELEDEGVQSGPVKWGMLVEGSGGRVVYMVDFEREVRGTVGFGGMEAREVVRALLAGWGEEGLVEEWEEIAYGEMGSDEIAGGQNGDNMEGVAREKEEEKEEEEEEEEKERKIKRRRKTNRRG